MKGQKDYQVAIAGAGPAGSLLARQLASSGISVAVFELKKEGTLGHNWSDAVEKSALAEAGFEIPAIDNGRYKGKLVKTGEDDDNLFEPHRIAPLQIRSPDLSCTTRTGVDFRYITTDRKVLGRRLAEQAAEAGAAFHYEHRADRLLGNTDGPLEDVQVKGLRVTDVTTEKSFEVAADMVVDATGYLSLLRTGLSKAAPINKKFEKGDLAYACRTVRRLDTKQAGKDDLTDHYRYGAFKGYFWTHIHHADAIDVGGGVREEPGRIDPMTVIEEMISQRPSITREELRGGGGIVLVGKSPYTLLTEGFLAVGDAAGQVIPTTGCGVGGAMAGALLAAETIIEALKKGDFSMETLWPYNHKWFSKRGSHFAALATLREILQDLTHEDITFLMAKDILSGEMLTPTINGIFEAPDLPTTIKTLVNGITRPGLLLKLNQATTMGKKIFAHYRGYPDTWQPRAFNRWAAKAETMFAKISG